jgi:hypothetical protein
MQDTIDALRQELVSLRQKVTALSHPYQDIRRMMEDRVLAPFFVELGDDNDLNADFSAYCASVAGTASYIIHGKAQEIPRRQVEWIAQGDFFAMFPKYQFLKQEWRHFPQFAQLYTLMRRMQEIELQIIDGSRQK